MLPSGLIGVIHVPAMPGDPRPGSFDAALDSSLCDAAAFRAGGVDTLVVENFGSAPFEKGDATSRLPPHQVAFLAILAKTLRDEGYRIGINCLRNDARSAMGIAAATGSEFIRVNVHTGAYVTDQGLIEGEAATTLRYRAGLNADVAIAADVLVKHAAPLTPIRPAQATEEAFDRGLVDAVIVSGDGTGKSVDLGVLQEVREAAGVRPVWIGSGLSVENVAVFAPLVDGAIVGSSVKRGGVLSAPVDAERVQRLVELFRPR